MNNKALIEELDKLLERLRVPSEVFLFIRFRGSDKFYAIFLELSNDVLLVVVCSMFDWGCV